MSTIQKKMRARLVNLAVGSGSDKPGFFIRYDYTDSLEKVVPPYPEVETLLSKSSNKFVQTISEFQNTLPDLRRAIKTGSVPWEAEGWFPVLDVVAAYHIVRTFQPNRIVEIGSGASTHVLSCAVSDNQKGEIVCIDPQPRRSISETGAKVERKVLSLDDVKKAEELEKNDILFIDSSHIMLPGMDVDIQFNRMFPKLPLGALVHVHDIFLPDNYPSEWKGRYFSEQQALIGWIFSGFFEVIYPSFYVATRLDNDLRKVLGDLMPLQPKNNAGSIWLRRRAPVGW